SRDDDGGDPAVIGMKRHVVHVTQAAAVHKVDDVAPGEVGQLIHGAPSPVSAVYDQVVPQLEQGSPEGRQALPGGQGASGRGSGRAWGCARPKRTSRRRTAPARAGVRRAHSSRATRISRGGGAA